MQRLTPRPVAAFVPEPRRLAADLWLLDRQLRMPGGARLPLRSVVVRLRSGALVVLSPPPLIEAAQLDALGDVAHVVAPNSFHYVYAADLMARFPHATLHIAPGLRGRVPALPDATELGGSAAALWPGEIEIAVLGPVRGVSEVVLFHCPTGTLLLTDLAFNMQRFERRFDRIAWRLSGVPAGFGPSRTARLLLLRDRAAAARCLDRVAEWPIQQIVVAHGDVIARDAKAAFHGAFAAYLSAPAAG